MRKEGYAFVRTTQEGRMCLKMYAAKNRLTMAEALVVLVKEALEREAKEQ